MQITILEKCTVSDLPPVGHTWHLSDWQFAHTCTCRSANTHTQTGNDNETIKRLQNHFIIMCRVGFGAVASSDFISEMEHKKIMAIFLCNAIPGSFSD